MENEKIVIDGEIRLMENEKIVIDLDKMTIGDLATFDDTSRMGPIVDLLDRVVQGGARHLPVKRLESIVNALRAQVTSFTSAKN